MIAARAKWFPLFAALALITSCGGASSMYPTGPDSGSNPPTPVSEATITVENNVFNPGLVTLAKGGTVTWNWSGSGHDLTSVGSPAFNAHTGTQGSGFTFGPVTFPTVGVYRFICSIHGFWDGTNTSGMAGAIKVQ